MTFHKYRKSPGRGRTDRELVTVVTRLRPDEIEHYRQAAERRGVPLASVVREALRDFILRGPAYEPERRP